MLSHLTKRKKIFSKKETKIGIIIHQADMMI